MVLVDTKTLEEIGRIRARDRNWTAKGGDHGRRSNASQASRDRKLLLEVLAKAELRPAPEKDRR